MIEIIPVSNTEFLHILVRGQVTNASAPQLEAGLVAALAGQAAPRCILDLGGLAFLSSAGLRVLLTIAKRIRNAGGALVLCETQPAVLTLLELAGFTRILAVVPDLATARDRVLSA